MRGWSVNTWIIAINVAVFVLGAFMQNAGSPVPVETGWVKSPSGHRITESPYLRGSPSDTPFYVTEAQKRQVGRSLHTRLVDADTGDIIGYEIYNVMDPLTRLGHFSTAKGFFFRRGARTYLNIEVWRLVTFQFLHSGLWHLVMNMFGLWIFGGLVEQNLGRKRYGAFYLMCGICGGLAYLLLNALGQTGLSLPGVLPNDPRTPLVGASAGVFGVILACAYLMPNERVFLLFFPVPIPLKIFAYGYVGFALFNLLTGGTNAGGDAAHIGGAIAGAFFIRHPHLLRDFFNVSGGARGANARKRGSSQASSKRKKKGASAKDKHIDRILTKVQQGGLQSLTSKERDILRRETEQRRDRP